MIGWGIDVKAFATFNMAGFNTDFYVSVFNCCPGVVKFKVAWLYGDDNPPGSNATQCHAWYIICGWHDDVVHTGDIRDADLILVMRDGNIIETGTHDELMARGGFYTELYNSQFDKIS